MYRFNGFTEKANKALNLAIDSAERMGHTYVGSEHILLGLLREGNGVAYAVLDELGVKSDTIADFIKEKIGVGIRTTVTTDDFTPRTKRILQISVVQAARLGHNYVGTEHILIAIIEESDSYAVRFLNELGIKEQEILNKIENKLGISAELDDNPYIGSQYQNKSKKNSATKTLEQFGRDLTEIASKGEIDPVIGRQEEIQRVIQILSRRTKNNPCLIGEPGVGKTAVENSIRGCSGNS